MEDELKLLVVEDDPVDAGIIRRVLEQPGLHQSVRTASSLENAKARLRSEHYDAVFLDLGLPDAQGLEGVLDIQASAPELPIVVVSGNADPMLAQRSVDMGAEDYILKDQLAHMPVERSVRYAIERHRRKTRLFQDNDALWRSLQSALRDSETDPLTGVANRRGLERHLEALAGQNSVKTATALVLDLDEFKKINDCHGHDVGDAVLRETVTRTLAGLDQADFLSRVGGDEFVAVIVRPERHAAMACAREVLAKICTEGFEWGIHHLRFSVTLALVEFTVGKEHLASILEKAHPLLERGKNGGRARLEPAWSLLGESASEEVPERQTDAPGKSRTLVSLADGSELGQLFQPGIVRAGDRRDHFGGSRSPSWLDGIKWAKFTHQRTQPGGLLFLDLEPDVLPPGFTQDLRTLFDDAQRPRCVLFFRTSFDEARWEVPFDEIRNLNRLGFQIGVRGLGGEHSLFENLLHLQPRWIRFDLSASMDLGRFPQKESFLRLLCAMLSPLQAHWIAEDSGEAGTLAVLKEMGFEAYLKV